MQKVLFSLVGFFFFVLLQAQQNSYEITGRVFTDDRLAALETATVYIEGARDTTLISYTITDRNGFFTLQGKTYEEKLHVYVSHVGYAVHHQLLELSEERHDLGIIPLKLASELEEVVLRSRVPIRIKKDTLEFNVASFNLKKEATVEDLLKELPGVEVDAEGKIRVNGKPVNRLLVNGKPFFDDDPTIATRTLTKEMIEKVQVMDTKSESQAFTGEEGSQENKTINLTISEEKNKGYFGRLAAGGGTGERFEYAGLVNRFNKQQRVSVLAGGNNINSPGFSFGEIREMYGGGRSMSVRSGGGFQLDNMSFGFGEGIVNSRNAGASYADVYGKITDVSVNYFYGGSTSENQSTTQRENIYPENRFFNHNESSTTSSTDTHMVQVKLDVKPDSTLLININPSFRYSEIEIRRDQQEITFDPDQQTINTSDYSNYTEGNNKQFQNRLDVTKKWGSRGAYARVNLSNQWNEKQEDNYLQSETVFYQGTSDDEWRNQWTESLRKEDAFTTNVLYAWPLKANELFLNMGYSYSLENKEEVKSTYDFDLETGNFNQFNTLVSTDFDFSEKRSKPTLGLSFRKNHWNFNTTLGYTFMDWSSSDRLRPELALSKSHQGLELNSSFSYRLVNNSSVYVSYSLNQRTPQISHMQAYTNINNPLHHYTGNPDLTPSEVHSMYMGYNAYDFQKGTGLNVYANLTHTNQAVIQNTTLDDNLIRHTTYQNNGSNTSANGGIYYSKAFTIDSLHSLKASGSFNLNYNSFTEINNALKYQTNNSIFSPSFSVTYTWKDVLEITPRYQYSYSLQQSEVSYFTDRKLGVHNLRLQTATFLPKRWEWRNELVYRYQGDLPVGYDKNSWFWNVTLAYSLWKDQATLTFKVYDLLNQNTNARRSVSENYIQDTESRVLQQYFMLSFSWKFNQLGNRATQSQRGGILRM